MVIEANLVLEWKPTNNPYMHTLLDGKYLLISEKGMDTLRAIQRLIKKKMTTSYQLMATESNYSTTNKAHDEETEKLLATIPDEMWIIHPTNKGFIESARQVLIKLKPNVRFPYQKQSPLTPQAQAGIRPTNKGLLKAGVLIPTQSQCNTLNTLTT